jgi:EAL domain-containing protein (putative c-di-GMP-specific phosphodiesterase class I)
VHADDLDDDRLFDPASPLARVAPRVVVEITERSSLDAVDRVEERIAALRALGFRIAIDDLGAGYADLTSLTRVAPEVVKIDMNLVRGIDADRRRTSLVRSLVDVSREMGAAVVAEGVETCAERDAVVALGCDLLQGFLIARPSPELVEVVLR